MKNFPYTLLLIVAAGLLGGLTYATFFASEDESVVLTESVGEGVTEVTPFAYTERYSARVDRVDVVFEHKDYTQYRLTTNGLVREGELNTERGFEDDVDATVYVLNWQKPEGEQILYVRLTNEPGRLYLLDTQRKIVRGSMLTLE